MLHFKLFASLPSEVLHRYSTTDIIIFSTRIRSVEGGICPIAVLCTVVEILRIKSFRSRPWFFKVTWRQRSREFYILRLVFLCQCYSCLATILSDVNCTSEWVLHSGTFASGDTEHDSASTLVECQAACEFCPHCVAVNWRSHDNGGCDLNTEPNHGHLSASFWNHYDLVSRCNITPGKRFDSISFSSRPLKILRLRRFKSSYLAEICLEC